MSPPYATGQDRLAFEPNCVNEWETKMNEECQQIHPDNTLFLIDYDDTILASNWLAARSLRLDSKHIPVDVKKELQVLEKNAVDLLSRTIDLGKVALVTNAEAGWIELSARKFLPALVPLLSKMRILSARTTYEKQFPKQTQLWKNAAYDQVFSEAFEKVAFDFQGIFNVISLGDSLYERSALLQLAKKSNKILGKSVKLIERPSVEQLQSQLVILVSNLDTITLSLEPIDLMLTVEYISECGVNTEN